MADPRITDGAVEAAARKRAEHYESEYDSSHLKWQDFAGEAREILAAALPHLASQPIDRGALIDALRGFAEDPDEPDNGWVFFADDPGDIADAVLALVRPMPTLDQVAEAVHAGYCGVPWDRCDLMHQKNARLYARPVLALLNGGGDRG